MSGLTLIMNAAEGLLQLAVLRDGQRLFAQAWNAPSRGTELLTPALREGFARMHLSIGDIDRIACVNGPGSFTGLRLVLSTAAALARTTGALTAGIDYMHALADRACQLPGMMVWAVTHARRGLVHLQGFTTRGCDDLPVSVARVEALDLQGAVERILRFGGAPVVLGSGLSRNRAFFIEHLPAALLLPADHDQPTIQSLMRLTAVATWSQDDVQPFYLRPCDAEENLADLVTRRGLDPDAARNTLSRLTTLSADESACRQV